MHSDLVISQGATLCAPCAERGDKSGHGGVNLPPPPFPSFSVSTLLLFVFLSLSLSISLSPSLGVATARELRICWNFAALPGALVKNTHL